MTVRPGLSSSFRVAQSLPVNGFRRRPSFLPSTLQVRTRVPFIRYCTIVLERLELPSEGVAFW